MGFHAVKVANIKMYEPLRKMLLISGLKCYF